MERFVLKGSVHASVSSPKTKRSPTVRLSITAQNRIQFNRTPLGTCPLSAEISNVSRFTLRDEQLMKILHSDFDEPLTLPSAESKDCLTGAFYNEQQLLPNYSPAVLLSSTSSFSNSDENMPPQDFIAHTDEGYLHFYYIFYFIFCCECI